MIGGKDPCKLKRELKSLRFRSVFPIRLHAGGSGSPRFHWRCAWMSLTITTPDSVALLEGLLDRIGQGFVDGWKGEGHSFTLADPEWGEKAWVRAFAEDGRLVLGLVPAEGGVMADGVYATYHGRLVEQLLRHFRGRNTSVEITGSVTYPDLLQWTGETQHAPSGLSADPLPEGR